MTQESGDGRSISHIGADDVDLEPGQTVGEYEVEAKIGEGGFGTVFRAVHPVIGKTVAIKVLARQFSAQPEMVSRFVAEARAVNQIRHRNIIDIFAFGQLEDGRHYYVMEYLDGAPMDVFLAERGRLELAACIPILRAVARALDAAHAKGIAHRDLKPENVFLVQEEDGTMYPKLLDFGIAKLLTQDAPRSHKTRTGAPLGTPHYMSPEQCRGRDVDHRTDIYAFGVVAYEALTGRLPFDGEDYMEVLMQQIQDEPAPPSSLVSELPASVDQGISWMLQKDPAARPPNLVTAVRSLEEAAAAAGIRVPTAPEPSGVYAASTSPVVAQATPSRVSAMRQSDTMARSETMGSAATMDAASLSSEMGPVPRGGSRSKALILVGAVVGAVGVGLISYLALSGGGGAEKTAPSTTAATTPPPVSADAAPVATTEPPDAAPATPERITLEVTGPPEGTEVYAPSGLVGTAPGMVQLPYGDEEVILTFKADGHRTATRQVIPNEDGAVEVALERKRRRRGGRGGRSSKGADRGGDRDDGTADKGRNELEDPFR